MKEINIGDVIIYNLTNDVKPRFYFGYVVGKDNLSCHVLSFIEHSYVIRHIDNTIDNTNNILKKSDANIATKLIESSYDKLIKDETAKIKTLSEFDKQQIEKEKYNDIKKRILVNCERCLNDCIDDVDLINRIKEISRLKNQLLNKDYSYVISQIHRYNGTIKYNIKQLEIQKRKALELISKGEFEKHFYFVQSKHKEIKNEN